MVGIRCPALLAIDDLNVSYSVFMCMRRAVNDSLRCKCKKIHFNL